MTVAGGLGADESERLHDIRVVDGKDVGGLARDDAHGRQEQRLVRLWIFAVDDSVE